MPNQGLGVLPAGVKLIPDKMAAAGHLDSLHSSELTAEVAWSDAVVGTTLIAAAVGPHGLGLER